MSLADDLAAAGVGSRQPLAIVVVPAGLALAWSGHALGAGAPEVRALGIPGDPAATVRGLAALEPRWVWWSADQTARPLVAAGLRLRACWDLGAVGRLLHGLRRDDPAAVWAAEHGLPEPERLRAGGSDLFDLDADDGEPVRADAQLSREWLRGSWATDLDSACRWATLALEVQRRQEAALRTVPERRWKVSGSTPLAVLTAQAESAAALLCVELEQGGLPLDLDVAASLLTAVIGPRPRDDAEQVAQRASRDGVVQRHFPGGPVDLRSPLQVRDLLVRVGIDLPDTRSWRLEPYAATSPAVAALLAWRKAERTATTYGWAWTDRHVGADRRLRGEWRVADGAAGRMTASAGLHNLPVELRPAVRAELGHVLVRADLGQVEPRVLAAVSGDPALALAAREDDMYAPVAVQLGCDRPTAKIAVLAAMYGQTSGTAGAALREMDRAYPVAMAYLRAAEQAGLRGTDLRTYGGRLLRLSGTAVSADPVPSGHGRFARNAVVQGAAAELFKAWAATVRDGLGRSAGGGTPGREVVRGAIVLCLHDELLLHVPKIQADAAVRLLHAALQATAHWWAPGSQVRFVAEVKVGASWAEAH